VGGRSRVAAQMLSGLGFKEVYNLAGGIKAFQGAKATGPQELNLELVRGDETPVEIIALAYGMENGLQLFYETMQEKTRDQDLRDLFSMLARVEARHKQRLLERYRQMEPAGNHPTLPDRSAPEILEGGFNLKEFLEKNEPYLQTGPQVLDLAMMLETQALDLYLRLAGRCSQGAAREVLLSIAEEEKAHLASLGRLLEAKLGEGN
jgi:rubrerythrin